MYLYFTGMLVLPNSYPYYLNMIESMHFGGALIFLAKFALAFPMMFHTCNGVRHLVSKLINKLVIRFNVLINCSIKVSCDNKMLQLVKTINLYFSN